MGAIRLASTLFSHDLCSHVRKKILASWHVDLIFVLDYPNCKRKIICFLFFSPHTDNGTSQSIMGKVGTAWLIFGS